METKLVIKTCWLLNIFTLIIFFSFFIQLSRSMTLTRNRRAFSYIANETICMVDNIVYHDGDPVPTDDPCESCKCRPPGFSCVLRECKVKPGCKQIRREGECCPEYQCGCEHNGKFFNDGDRIPNAESPCYSCFCQGSSITCALADCKFRFDCEPEYVANECCPRYDHCQPEPTIPTSTHKSVVTSVFTSLSPILNVTTLPSTVVSLASVSPSTSTSAPITTIKSLPTTMTPLIPTTQAPQLITTTSSSNLSSTTLSSSTSGDVIKVTTTDVPEIDIKEVTTVISPKSEVIEPVDTTTLPSSTIESIKKNLTSPSTTSEVQDITTLLTTEESITTVSSDQAISSSTQKPLTERPTTLSTTTTTGNNDMIFFEKTSIFPETSSVEPEMTTLSSSEKDITSETTQTPQDEIPTGLVIIKSTKNGEKMLTTVTPSTRIEETSNFTSSLAKLTPTEQPSPASGGNISHEFVAKENFNTSSSTTPISSDEGTAIALGEDEINSNFFTTISSNYPVNGSGSNSSFDSLPDIGSINGSISDSAPDNISIEDNFPTTRKWVPTEELEAEHKNTESNDLQPIVNAPTANITSTTTVSSNISATTTLETTEI